MLVTIYDLIHLVSMSHPTSCIGHSTMGSFKGRGKQYQLDGQDTSAL